MIPIREAVHANLARSREIYEWVSSLCSRLGAGSADLVPFEKYAKAAESLLKPSSAARALFGGAEHIERVDSLVHCIARELGAQCDTLREIVRRVDERLARNRLALHGSDRPAPNNVRMELPRIAPGLENAGWTPT